MCAATACGSVASNLKVMERSYHEAIGTKSQPSSDLGEHAPWDAAAAQFSSRPPMPAGRQRPISARQYRQSSENTGFAVNLARLS